MLRLQLEASALDSYGEKMITIFDDMAHQFSVAMKNSKHSDVDRKRFLRVWLPTPEMQKVHIDEFHAKRFGVASGDFMAWFVIRMDPQSVFWDERTRSFGVCWGPDNRSGAYEDIGYRSEDPVEMFLS